LNIARGIDFQTVRQLLDESYLMSMRVESFIELEFNPDSDDEFPEGYEYYYINPEFAAVIDKAIKKNSADRYQTAEEFLEALDKVKV